MLSAAVRPPIPVVCLLLVALWLGWTGIVLVRLHRLPAGDPAELANALSRLTPQDLAEGRPLAVLLASSCPCQEDRNTWSAIGQVIAGHGGRLLEKPVPTGTATGIELLVLDARGQPVYSGPLSPPPGVCGSNSADPGTWLPLLLDGRQPPLHLGALPCPC